MADPVYITIEEEVIELIEAGQQGPAGPQGDPGEGIAQDYVDAMDNANAPSTSNPFATIADVPTTPGDISAEPAQTAASQSEAEAGTEEAIRSWSPLRIWQAITAKLATWKTILGQKDYLQSFTHAGGSAVTLTAAMDYNAGNAAYIDSSNLGADDTLTMTMANWPANAADRGAFSLVIKTGAALPGTINWPSGWTNPPTLTVIKTNELVARSIGATAPRLKTIEVY